MSSSASSGLPTGKLRLDDLLSGEGKAGTIRDIIGGAIGKPQQGEDNAPSIEDIIGGGGTENEAVPPAPPADAQSATPDAAGEPPSAEGERATQQPEPDAQPPAQEEGTLGRLFNLLQ
ncbi:hypothetical protein [Ensifer sp. MJa1]|uniref:hypothetical protein n=1 Tax=Ensifer sp. MJa1 TaxID=2919888 RepID=UPI00300A8F36